MSTPSSGWSISRELEAICHIQGVFIPTIFHFFHFNVSSKYHSIHHFPSALSTYPITLAKKLP